MASGSAKSRMERILRLHDEIDQIKADIRDIYAEEKSDGGDKTAMGAAISIIRKRAKDSAAFEEREALTDVYLNAYNAPSHTHAPARTHEGQSYAEAKGREFPNDPADLTAAETVELRRLTDPQEQPETANQSGQEKEVRRDVCAFPSAAGTDFLCASAPAGSAPDAIPSTHSHSPATPSPQAQQADKADDASLLPASSAVLSEKPGCLKLKDGHCRLSFATSALCSDCNMARMRATA